MTTQPLIICATTRLARGMQLREQLTQTGLGRTVWQAANATTLTQWLSSIFNNAILAGDIAVNALPLHKLNGFSETHFWHLAIETCLAKHEAAALFDVKALAKSAMQASKTMIEWRISEAQINADYLQPETRQFLRWRNAFYALCAQKNALDAMQYEAQQIALLITHHLPLPSHIIFAGFDRITPLQQLFMDYCIAQGVAVTFEKHTDKAMDTAIDTYATKTVPLQKIALADAHAECLAAVAWAQKQLQQNPNAQLAILSPVLGDVRRQLVDFLDETFHPNTWLPQHIEAARCYDTALGDALTAYPIVHSAMQLLRIATQRFELHFETMTAFLQDAYWGDLNALSHRAQLDFNARRGLSMQYSLASFVDFVQTLNKKAAERAHANMPTEAEYADLHAQLNLDANLDTNTEVSQTTFTFLTQLLQTQQAWLHTAKLKKRSPADWVAQFLQLLTALNWAKTRSLSSAEYQTQQKFLEALQSLEALDGLLGLLTAEEAYSQLLAICQNSMFQPEAAGKTNIQLLGLLETPALKLDAVWIMQMNDQHWPPAVALNPLLPVKLQRDLQLPNASAEVQTQFAMTVHHRLTHMAKTVVFSYALKDEERELRPSPMLESVGAMPQTNIDALTAAITNAQAQRAVVPKSPEVLADSTAPALQPHAPMRGGTRLLATQAICPAWAFYAFRLGAKKLETPKNGLNSMVRGQLLHAVLQCFWERNHSLQALKAMNDVQKAAAIHVAIAAGFAALNLNASHNVLSQVLALEFERITLIMNQFLALEVQRADFNIVACEQKHIVEIAGLTIHLTIDRIDHLVTETGDALVVIDYKTSATVNKNSWADARIREPQLPIYVALALQEKHVAAVCFAQLHSNAVGFVGLAEEAELLPEVTTLQASSAAFKRFDSWQALQAHWHKALLNVAQEVQQGVASVTFKNEQDLLYCEVLPLLRLPERLMQYEKNQQNNLSAE